MVHSVQQFRTRNEPVSFEEIMVLLQTEEQSLAESFDSGKDLNSMAMFASATPNNRNTSSQSSFYVHSNQNRGRGRNNNQRGRGRFSSNQITPMHSLKAILSSPTISILHPMHSLKAMLSFLRIFKANLRFQTYVSDMWQAWTSSLGLLSQDGFCIPREASTCKACSNGIYF
jgi:hypothetical protein